MPAIGVLLVTVIACGLALRARLRVALATLFTAMFLVPDTLLVPRQFTVSSYVTVSRAVIFAFALGIIWRVRRGEMSVSSLRPRRVHLVLVIFVGVAYVNGVALAAPTTDIAPALHIWLGTVDDLVFFWSALAAIRALDDDLWVGKAVGVVLVATAVIAIIEHFDHGSYARWWFEGQPNLLNTTVPASPLELRGTSVRVRAADQFALAFGWISVMLSPLLLAVVPYVRSRLATLAKLAPVVVIIAVLWSQSRSPLLGLALGAAALLLLSRLERRLTPYLLGAALIALLAGLLTTALSHPFLVAQSGSTSVRSARLPVVFNAISSRPYLGLGWTGLQVVGVSTTDSSYLTIYGSLGVVGATTLFVLLGTALATAAGSLRVPSGPRRALAAASVAGILVALVAPLGYDLFSQPSSTEALWLLVAMGIAIGERGPVARSVTATPLGRVVRYDWPARLAAPVVGALAGLSLLAIAPTHYTATYRFDSMPFSRLAAATNNQIYIGQVLVNSICASIENQPLPDGATATCRDLNAGPGTGEVQITSSTASGTSAAEQATINAGNRFPGFAGYRVGGVTPGKPTGLKTAPVSLALVGFALGLLVPPRVQRRVAVPDTVSANGSRRQSVGLRIGSGPRESE
jgi:hypothetical protein